jgi:hypothetical protein
MALASPKSVNFACAALTKRLVSAKRWEDGFPDLVLMGIYWKYMETMVIYGKYMMYDRYPLVIIQKAIEHCHRNS